MAVTPEEINNALAIISENLDVLDKEQKKTARGYVELLKNNNTNRTPFYDAVFEALQQNGRVSVEDMWSFPSAPKKSDRNTRNKAIKFAQERLGVSIKREGNYYVTQEDLSEHVSWFKSKNRMNKATFEFNCERRGVAPESMKTALRDAGVMFTQQGEMIV